MAILSHQSLVKLVTGSNPVLTALSGRFPAEQVRMASIDLPLGGRAFAMRASALPSAGRTVADLVKTYQKQGYSFALSPTEPKLFARGQTYLVPLDAQLALPRGFSAKFSPKSSTGRVDTFVRVLADGVSRFDHLPLGYTGPLYIEITPLSFDILLCAGQSLTQMRMRSGEAKLSERELAVFQSDCVIVWKKDGTPVPTRDLELGEHGIYMHVDLEREVVGFVARDPTLGEIPFSSNGALKPEDFWEAIPRPTNGAIVINPSRFYLLATQERIKIPPCICGDIAPYDPSAGEFRTHYAGFFDPGFGAEKGTVGVMEVRGREVPFVLTHGHPVCRMDFERLDEVPALVYGDDPAKSSYTAPRASLAKFFERATECWPE